MSSTCRHPFLFALPVAAAAFLGCESAESASPGDPSLATGAEVLYEVSFDGAAHHEAEIRLTVSGLGSTPLDLRMSRTSPGRYALHEFAKNVYDLRFTDGAATPVASTSEGLHDWRVVDHDGTVVVTYTLFGDRADGTYAGIDRTQAHLNMPASFMWAADLDDTPIRIRFRPPEGSEWKVATQLVPTDDPLEFTSPDLYYFLDSPTHLSDFSLRSWTVPGPGGDQTVRVAVHHDGTEGDVDRFVGAVQRIVAEEIAMWGGAPSFDYGTYTFISAYLPWVNGDGMEHRNSTILTSTSSISGDQVGILGTVAHEFFHAWNVERMRPASLEPFDFERANVTSELWLAEGFTSYFDDLALVRAGVIDEAEFARRLGNAINTVQNGPGRRLRSPMEMSRRAPFVDAAVSIDPQNTENTFISYYTWGSVVGAGLDLTLRQMDGATSLEGFMREMWARHGAEESPYDIDDIEAALAAVMGDAGSAEEFIARYVRGREVPGFGDLLSLAGMELRKARPGQATFGRVTTAAQGGALAVTSRPLVGEPLHQVGIELGDRIISVGGSPAGPISLAAVASGLEPGTPVPMVWESRGSTLRGTATLIEDPAVEVVLVEGVGGAPTEVQRAFREGWLRSRAGG